MGYTVVLNEDLLAFDEDITMTTSLRVDVGEAPGRGYQLRLGQIRRIEAVAPWPALEIAWSTKHLDLERTLVPPPRRFGFGGPSKTQLAHERMVVALIERLTANPHAAGIDLRPGWAGVPIVPWAEADAFPDEEEVSGDGAFRSSADPDRIVARRAKPTAFEALLEWLASSPERRLADTPREVVLTREHVYVRLSAEGVHRLPRATLRERLGPIDGDAVYVFGRRTRLVLTRREACPVRAALDRQLAELDDETRASG